MVAEQGYQGEQRVVASQAWSSVIVVVALAVVVVASS